MKIERLDFEIESNCPILARVILFFMLPKFIVKGKFHLTINKQVYEVKTVYYIPRFKVRKYEN